MVVIGRRSGIIRRMKTLLLPFAGRGSPERSAPATGGAVMDRLGDEGHERPPENEEQKDCARRNEGVYRHGTIPFCPYIGAVVPVSHGSFPVDPPDRRDGEEEGRGRVR